MGLTVKTGYALRALLELAKAQKNGVRWMAVKQILAVQSMPRDFLEKILGELRAAGIVRSSRGRNGGYALAKPAGRITVKSVVDVLEKPLRMLKCVVSEKCPRFGDCAVKFIWYRVNDVINRELSKLTLKDLMEMERKMKEGKKR